MIRPLSIAIDGPAGAGKSTVSKLLASELGYELLDTGAMYRAMAWILLAKPELPEQLWPQAVGEHQLDPVWRDGQFRMLVDGLDISSEIRSEAVTGAVSRVAANRELREIAVLLQRQYVDTAIKSGRGVVLEGRDIGTTVLPQASIKFFLTASAQVRAERRAAEIGANAEEVLSAVLERDAADSSREVSPLKIAADAHLVDASDLSAEAVVAKLKQAIEQVAR